MATLVLTNPYFLLNAVNLTGYVRQLTIEGSLETAEDTANSSGTGVDSRTYVGTMKSATLKPTFNFDLGASGVEKRLWDIWNGGTAVAWTAAAAGSAAGTSNPHYSGSAILTETPFISGTIGEKVEATFSFQVTGAIARATA